MPTTLQHRFCPEFFTSHLFWHWPQMVSLIEELIIQEYMSLIRLILLKYYKECPSIEALNEIDVDSQVNHYKPERMSVSGMSFPTTPSTTTELNIPIYETTPTEPPLEYIEHPPHAEERPDDEHDHPEGGEQEDDEQTPSEDQEDYEDDEELESFRYPVKVNYPDNDDYKWPRKRGSNALCHP